MIDTSAAAKQAAATFTGGHQSKLTLNDYFATRLPTRAAFLKACGWDDAVVTPLREDMAARRYYRLSKNGETRVLMESVPDTHEFSTPGHLVADYLTIADLMRAGGLSTPKIFASDVAEGYVLLQDFGDVSFRSALIEGTVSRDVIYDTAMDVIQKIFRVTWPADQPRPDYYEGTMYKGLRRMIDWYVPMKRGQKNEPWRVDAFMQIWDQIESDVTARVGRPIQGFIHCDFHLENVQWRAHETGLARAGLLDFQDSRMGPAVYDLTNLLNDARVALPPDYKRAKLDTFLAKLPKDDRDNFRAWFWVYSAQFLHRVAGQFVKHATIGNTKYLQFMPFIQANLADIMSEPDLAPMVDFMADMGVDLAPFADGFDFSGTAPRLIAGDAY